ncbi:MAG: hypothetical protein RBT49_14305 [Bacteroidales bacterium]|nr:hypothetical protein [Bacteroidales bacterium]
MSRFEKSGIFTHRFLITYVILFMLTTSYSENRINLEPSVYLGIGNGTNLGGFYGLGSEVGVNKFLSFNGSFGIIPPINDESTTEYGFDLGLKIYPIKYFFLGINYGTLLGIDYFNGDKDEYVYENQQALSFTLGLKSPDFKNAFLSVFFGTTSKPELNNYGPWVYDFRMGVILGYIFKKSE